MRIKVIALVLMICLLFSGCSKKVDNDTRFVPTGNTYEINNITFTEQVDTETNNLYLIYNGYNQMAITPLYDSNGNIAKYNKEGNN